VEDSFARASAPAAATCSAQQCSCLLIYGWDKYFRVHACCRRRRLILIPLALAAPPSAAAGFLAGLPYFAGVWVAVKPLPNPGDVIVALAVAVPGGRLAYVFTVLLCVNVALAFSCFSAASTASAIRSAGAAVGVLHRGKFSGFGCIAIPLASHALHRICTHGRSGSRSASVAWHSVLYGVPEEFLFAAAAKHACGHPRATLPAGGPLPFSLAFLTSPTWLSQLRYVVLASSPAFLRLTWRKTARFSPPP